MTMQNLAHDLFRPSIDTVLGNLSQISKTTSQSINNKEKAKYSQYFTEGAVAQQMAKMLTIKTGAVIGDHGAGTGLLCSTVLAYALAEQSNEKIPFTLNAYELDGRLHKAFGESMSEIDFFAQSLLNASPNVTLNGDFTQVVDSIKNGTLTGFLDSAILNPPYQKLNQQTDFAKLMKEHLVATPNMYAAFIALSIAMLKPSGELVAIVPRSFTNGTYFKAFRKFLKEMGSIDWFVRYQGRSNLFRGDNVLQENVTFRFTRGVPQVDRIRVSLCESPEHPPIYESLVPVKDIFPEDSDIIFVPSCELELDALHKMRAMENSAADIGIGFSTGKLEDCRMRSLLDGVMNETKAPVVYSQHWERGETQLNWAPIVSTKPACLLINEDSKKKLVPRGNYVLIKRISANDDSSGRCHPCVLADDNAIPGDLWAIDNHIQVISGIGGKSLTKQDANAIAEYLTSAHIDHVLRVVSGTTQLNKNDLLQIRYPNGLI